MPRKGWRKAAAVAEAAGDAHALDRRKRRELAAVRRRERGAAYLAEAAAFRKQLFELGCFVREIRGDGNCMFRAVSDQLYGNEERHALLRSRCCDFMRANEDGFAPFLLEEDGHGSFAAYMASMAKDGEWGGHMELQALSRALGVNVMVHQVGQPRWELVNNKHHGARGIHISYHDGDHYNSVRALDDDTDGPARPIVLTTVLKPGSLAAAGGGGEITRPAGSAASWDDMETKASLVLCSLPRGPGRPGRREVLSTLADVKGDIDAAIEVFLASMTAHGPAPATADVASGTGMEAPTMHATVPTSAGGAGGGATWVCEACSYADTPTHAAECGVCGTAASVSDALRAANGGAGDGGDPGPPRRNGPCPCGSGKVYRKCCQDMDLAAARKAKAIAAAVNVGDEDEEAGGGGKRGGRGRRKDGKTAPVAAASPDKLLAAGVTALRI